MIAGHVVNNPSVKVSYPLDNSVQSQLTRADTALVTLQYLSAQEKDILQYYGCTVLLTTLVFGLQYGSWSISYCITAVNIWLYAVYGMVCSPTLPAIRYAGGDCASLISPEVLNFSRYNTLNK